jgi:hypothetical protein
MLLNQLALAAVWRGDFAAAAALIAEADAVCKATGARIAPYAALMLVAFRGREVEAVPLIQAALDPGRRGGAGAAVTWAHWAAARPYNGLGRHAATPTRWRRLGRSAGRRRYIPACGCSAN